MKCSAEWIACPLAVYDSDPADGSASPYVRGWKACFGMVQMPKVWRRLEEWIHHWIRAIRSGTGDHQYGATTHQRKVGLTIMSHAFVQNSASISSIWSGSASAAATHSFI